MATHNLQLLGFSDFIEEKLIGLGPRVYVAIKHPSDTIKYKKGKNEIEYDTICPDCANYAEFELEINRLIRELQTIKKQGKIFFQKEVEKRKKYIENKSKSD